jgi:hypothetical protein
MVPSSVQWYEVVWIAAVVYTFAVHTKLRTKFIQEKAYQIAQNQNGILNYIADTGIFIQTWLRRVQYCFGAIGVFSLLRTPSRSPDWRTWISVGSLIGGEIALAQVATLIARRHEGELKLARTLIDQGMLDISAQFGTDLESSLRNVVDQMGETQQEMAQTLQEMKANDKQVAKHLAVAQKAVDQLKRDSDASRVRADAVDPESSPGSAADAASQSGE